MIDNLHMMWGTYTCTDNYRDNKPVCALSHMFVIYLKSGTCVQILLESVVSCDRACVMNVHGRIIYESREPVSEQIMNKAIGPNQSSTPNRDQ